jgi:sugar phosphate permease
VNPAQAESQHAPDPRRWRLWRAAVFSSTWVAYAGYYFCRRPFYAVKKPMGDELGFDAVALAHLGAAYLIAYTLGQFVAAGVGQRTGARVMLLSGGMVSILANVAFGMGSSFWAFMGLMAVNGLAQATGWSACVATMGNWTSRDERGTVMGFWSTCYQLGGILAMGWAGMWLARSGWRGAFFAGSAVLFAGWIVVHLLQRDTPSDAGLPPLPEEKPLRAGEPAAVEGWTRGVFTTVVLVGLCYFGIKFVRYAVWSWASYFLGDYYGVSGERASYYSSIFDVGGVLGVIIAGLVSDKLFRGRRAGVSFVFLGGMTASCALLYFLGAQSLTWFMIGLLLVGFTLYGPDSLLTGAGAIDVGSPRIAIAAAGIISGIGSIGSVLQEHVVAGVYGGGKEVTAVLGTLFGASLLAMAMRSGSSCGGTGGGYRISESLTRCCA